MPEVIQDERKGLPSASFFPIGVKCHGAWELCKSVPPSKASSASTSGDKIHKALETDDDSGLSIADMDVAERIRAIEKPELERFATDNHLTRFIGNFEATREKRFWLSIGTNMEMASAKLDVVYRLGQYAMAINYKTGWKRVTAAAENWQILTEAACYLSENSKIKVMRIGFISARLKSQIEWVDLVKIDRGQLMNQVLSEVDKWTPTAERTPGEWCRYCPGRAWCDKSLAIAEAPSLEVAPSDAKTQKDRALEMVSRMTEAQMASVIRKGGLILAIIDAAKDRAMAMDVADLDRIGLERKKGRRWSKFTDYGMATRRIVLKGLMSEDQVNEASDMSIGSVIESVAKADGLSREKASVQVREELGIVIETGNHAETVGAKEE